MNEYHFSMYDKEEKHENCTVQILENTITGEQSIGWWENKVNKVKWIKAKHYELPEEEVLAIDENGDMAIGTLCTFGMPIRILCEDRVGDCQLDGVTHFAYLPEPPKEEETDKEFYEKRY